MPRLSRRGWILVGLGAFTIGVWALIAYAVAWILHWLEAVHS